LPTSANASGSASGLVHLIGNQVGTLTMADVAALTYRAFISYSHKDTDRATWLHRRLERYPLKGLTGRDTPRGPVPKTLRPIFRDRHDFSAGFTLKEQTVTALDASAALIVLASPASAKSLAVNEEIRLFRVLYPDRPVIPPIAGGRPDGGGEEECFPSALKFAISADGAITDTPVTILGADLRDEGDGEELALAKVVAALIGVPSDEVFRRAERERRRAARIRSAIAAGFVALAGAGGYFSWQAYRQQAELVDIQKLVDQYAPIGSAEARQPGARERLAATFASIAKGTAADPRYRQALDLLKAGKPQDAEPLLKQSAEEEEAAGLARIKQAAEKYRNLGSIASTSDPKRARDYYAKAVQLDPANIRGLADSAELEKDAGNLVFAEKSYASVLALGRKGEHDRDRYFAALGLGDIALARGNLNAALTSYRDASADADSLAKADPTNAGWQRDLSVSYDKVGDVLQAQGDLPGALKAHRDSLAIRDRRAKADPANAAWQRDLSVSYDRIGDVLTAQGDLPGALRAYQDSLTIADRLAKADPANAGWQRDLSVSYNKVGDVLTAQGDLPGALKAYRDSLAIRDRLAKVDPANAGWQRDLSVSYINVGDVLTVQGDLPGALKAYRDGLTIADRLAKADPANAGWQRDLSVSYDRMGDVLTAQGDLPGALKAYRDSLAIADRLAKADPANAGWQRDLSVSYNKVGDALKAQGDLPGALKAYRDSLAIFDRLAKADPANTGWQYDLGVSHERIGNILIAQGDLVAAKSSYETRRDIIFRLAKADPANAGWQRDLSVSYINVGDVLRVQGDLPGALKAYRDGLAIADRLAQADAANAGWQRDLSVSYDRIGDVLKAQGDLPGALKAYRDSLAIRNRLAKADPANAGWQRDVAVSYAKLADVFQRQNEAGKAREAYAAGLAIMKRMAALSPDNSTWKRDLAWFEARLPALEENAAATQAAQGIAAAREAGEHAKAAKLGLDQARAIEAAETEKDGKPGRKTASALGNYAFSAIFAKQYAEALAAAERAMSLAPDKLWIATNRAHALLFLGRADEARAAYLEHRGKPMPGNENKPWEQVIADDFTELQKRGLSHPQMAEVLAALSR
jgi:tetratricopeptide (TPR) repeat protein